METKRWEKGRGRVITAPKQKHMTKEKTVSLETMRERTRRQERQHRGTEVSVSRVKIEGACGRRIFT